MVERPFWAVEQQLVQGHHTETFYFLNMQGAALVNSCWKLEVHLGTSLLFFQASTFGFNEIKTEQTA